MTILKLDNVTLRYTGKTKPALEQINYTIHQGDFVILLGSNGSGKSSLLKLFSRHHQPEQGNIHFLDKSINHYHEKEFSQQISILTQNCSDSLFTSLTVYENYLLVKESTLIKKINDPLERQYLQTHLADYNTNLATKLDCPVHQLSGGEKQTLALAYCLLKPPSLLLLDEHTSALDPKTSEQIMTLTQKMIIKNNITCVLTTHDLDIALNYGNRILMLHDGKIHKLFDKEHKLSLSKETLIAHYYT